MARVVIAACTAPFFFRLRRLKRGSLARTASHLRHFTRVGDVGESRLGGNRYSLNRGRRTGRPKHDSRRSKRRGGPPRSCRFTFPISMVQYRMTTTRGKLVAFALSPRVIRDVLRLASPRMDVQIHRTAAAALSALQSAGNDAVLVAEQLTPAQAGTTGEPGAMVLMEAAKVRCPDSNRVLLVADNDLPSMISILHSGAAKTLVPLPIVAKEFLLAICPDSVFRKTA